jgi:hypothetical protein
MTRFFFVFFLTLFSIYPIFAQDLFEKENSLLFARHLFNSQQYDFAAKELERVLFMDSKNDEVKLLLLKCYLQKNDIPNTLKRGQLLYQEFALQPRDFARVFGKALLLADSLTILQQLTETNPNLTTDDKIQMKFLNAVATMNWESAMANYAFFDEAKMESHEQFKEYILYTSQQKNKNVYLATGLSTIIPGAGKVYTRDWKDAIFSFVAFGTTAFQSYRSFSKLGTNSKSGWIFGGIATTFYAGNIYGSNKAAKKYNQRIKSNAKERFQHLLLHHY